MPRSKDEKLHAIRQQQILDAAKDCFIANGFHQTSMRQIFDASGISAGGAYNYFASKADIVKGIVEEERADITMLESRLKSTKDPLAGVARLIRDIIDYTSYESAVLTVEIHAEACRNKEIGDLTTEVNAQLHSLIHDAISRGRKTGDISSDFSVNEMTQWVIALLEGYLGRIASNPELKPKKLARIAERSVLRLLTQDTNSTNQYQLK